MTEDLRPMNDEPDLPEDLEDKVDIWEGDPDAPPTPQERGWGDEVDLDAEDRPRPEEDPDLATDAGAEAALQAHVQKLDTISSSNPKWQGHGLMFPLI